MGGACGGGGGGSRMMLILYIKKEDAYSSYDDINDSDFVDFYEDGNDYG